MLKMRDNLPMEFSLTGYRRHIPAARTMTKGSTANATVSYIRLCRYRDCNVFAFGTKNQPAGRNSIHANTTKKLNASQTTAKVAPNSSALPNGVQMNALQWPSRRLTLDVIAVNIARDTNRDITMAPK
jgi:hypothetical protein